MKKVILGAKYFLKDKILNDIVEAKILNVNEEELSYKNLITQEEFYREIQEVEVVSIINELEAQRLNNQKIFSIQTDLVKAIIGREEILKYSINNFKDLDKNENTVLISITDPGKSLLPEKILSLFKDSLSVQFWDVEEEIGGYKPISEEIANQIKEFILKNKDNNFIVHCEAGMSRSAGVGLSIFMLIEHKGDRYAFATSSNPITNHHRYHPNYVVYDKIVK